MRVLIVDDHERIRRGVRLLLSRVADVQVCGEAVNGSEALDATMRYRPDVIIMDADIPGVNGIEVTRQIRRVFPKIEVVIMSLYDIPKAKEEALKAGAVAYVTKSSVWKLVPVLQRMQAGVPAASDESDVTSPAAPHSQNSGDLEAILRDCEERFRSTFEQMAVGMGQVDSEGRWLRVNEKLCEVVGYTKKEMQQLKLQDITHPEDLAAALALDKRVAAGEVDHYFLENRYIRKDGNIAWIRLTVNAVRDTEGKLKYCLHVLEDATASKETEGRLAQVKRDLQLHRPFGFSRGPYLRVADSLQPRPPIYLGE